MTENSNESVPNNTLNDVDENEDETIKDDTNDNKQSTDATDSIDANNAPKQHPTETTEPDNPNITSTSSKITLSNTFYNKLLDDLLVKDVKFNQNFNNILINKASNTSSTFNCSGNIRIQASLPKSSTEAPNYMNDLLKTDLPQDNILSLFKTLFNNPNFICPSYDISKIPSNTTSSTKNITYSQNPKLNLSNELDSSIKNNQQWHTWNLNYNRNYTPDSIKQTVAVIVRNMNKLIDYVITNDISKPDDTFRQLLKNVFCNSSGTMYSYSHNTLLLPTMIDMINLSKGFTKYSTSNIGYIGKGTKILNNTDPKTDYENMQKWNLKNATVGPKTIFQYIIKSDVDTPDKYIDKTAINYFKDKDNIYQYANIGMYNYPLSADEQSRDWQPSTTNLNETDYNFGYENLIKNIQLGVLGEANGKERATTYTDAYQYVDPKDSVFGIVQSGEETQAEPIRSGRALYYDLDKMKKGEKCDNCEYIAVSNPGDNAYLPLCVHTNSVNKKAKSVELNMTIEPEEVKDTCHN